jgi:Amt family ammonium transporter
VVHVTGGMSALYATCILGPRQGRFYDRHGNKLARPGLRKGSSVALQVCTKPEPL